MGVWEEVFFPLGTMVATQRCWITVINVLIVLQQSKI